MPQGYKVYYINLIKDKNRDLFMGEQLSRVGFDFERVEGVYGREYEWSSGEYDSDRAKRVNGRDLTEGERGCALSHRRCAEMLLVSGGEYALILEDDVELPDDFKSVVEEMIEKNNKNKKFEYLAFDYPETGVFFIRHWLSSLSLSFANIKNKNIITVLKFLLYTSVKGLYIIPLSLAEALRDYFYKNILKSGEAVQFARPLYFASCYLITRAGAEKLIALNTPIVYAADRVQNVARVEKSLAWRAYTPLITRQRREDFGSSILGVTGEHFKK